LPPFVVVYILPPFCRCVFLFFLPLIWFRCKFKKLKIFIDGFSSGG